MGMFAVVLVVESDETSGAPTSWPWGEWIDGPGSVGVVQCVQVDSEPSDRQVEALAGAGEAFAGLLRLCGVAQD